MAQDTATIAMTYTELAKRLSIKPASAKRLAQRRKWHRVVGNDGVALVHVPKSAVPDDVAPVITDDVADDVSPDKSPPVTPIVTPDLEQKIAHLEGTVEGLRGQVEAEQRRAEAERQRADAAEARVADIASDREAWKRQAQRSLWAKWFGSSSD
ncbi:hypothetical protein PANO111632_20995 [Paracoccus nototheniae]|uniref:hypothetical protein n=1 Tax=Paracoccus nototheniae TaxID=2489002 RepID=UPI001039A558|nr:hypothetical protein [Paracoccus nototheniae]